jgi:hypothetical protein
MRRALLLGAVLTFASIGCGDDEGDDDDDVVNDGGRDASGGGGGGDAGRDASMDASGPGTMDASQDAARPPDASTPSDASADAARSDASTTDAATMDAAAALESWALIYTQIITPRCLGCHNMGQNRGEMNLAGSAGAARTELLRAAEGPECAGDAGGGTRVVPGNATNSLLIKKITLPDDQVCGNAMPRPGGTYMMLPAPEIERIRRWVTQGALDN